MSKQWRRQLLNFLVVITLGAPAIAAAPKPDVAELLRAPHVSGELIIRFKTDAPKPARLSLMQRWGATSAQHFLSGAEHWILGKSTDLERALRELQSSSLVEYAEPNYRRSIELEPNDPFYSNLYGLKNTGQTGGVADADIDAEFAWDITTGDHAVLIAVLDTGIDRTHPDLAANIWTNPLEIPGNGIDDDLNGYIDDLHGWDFVYGDNDPSDYHSHGTHVSGTIGGVGNNGIGVVGVNWNVSLVAVKILSDDGYGSDASIIPGIDYAAQIGATAINASWGGGGFSTAMMESIRHAGEAGVLFIAAAGNYSSNNDTYPFYPATYDVPNLLAVAATDNRDALAWFSNFGASSVDLGAPGVDTYSSLPGATYGYKSGTSMATPHVVGVAALIKSLAPDITMEGLRNQLLETVDQIPALAGITVTGGRLNAFSALGVPDSVAPSQVLDLTVDEETSSSIVLTWSAPGGNGTSGRAGAYELRYSTAPIDDLNFEAANLAVGTPRPAYYGSTERFEVSGLATTTTYYFAIRSRDEWGNKSAPSNVVNGTTLGPPTLATTPDSFEVTVASGQSTQRTLSVQNAGIGTLDWSASILTPGVMESTPQEPLDLAKGEPDPRKGPPAIQRRGGPDAFGYRYIDSDDPTGPVFEWTDISATGQKLLSLTQDDEVSEPIEIGFPFRFYGTDFDSVRISTNGALSFTGNSLGYTNQPLPSPAAAEFLVAPFWDDLQFDGVARVTYQSDGQQFTVQYTQARGSDGTSVYTFQVSLYADGTIMFRYLTLTGLTTGATIGIQDGNRTIALPIAFNTTYARNSFAVEITAAKAWVTVQPTAGRNASGEVTQATVTFDARQLDGGTYDSQLLVASNDPLQPQKYHGLRLNVTGAPDLRVLGREQRVTSERSYVSSGAQTAHQLTIDPAVTEGATLVLTAYGDYGNDTEHATVIMEGEDLGSTAAMGLDCTHAQRTYPISSALIQRVASDGVVDVQVANSPAVDAFCSENKHKLELLYRLPIDRLEFGSHYVGASQQLSIELRNVGTDPLVISSIQSSVAQFTASSAALTLLPRHHAQLTITFQPNQAESYEGRLRLESNDPDTPIIEIDLSGAGLLPPEIAVTPLQFAFDLLSGVTEARELQLDNSGGAVLSATLLAVPMENESAATSHFEGLSRGDMAATHNGVTDQPESAPAESPFVPADRVFTRLASTPSVLTCLVADTSTRSIYAQANQSSNFYRFDSVAGSWQQLGASPLFSGNNGGATWLNGKIYTSYTENATSIGVYDIAAGSWTTITQPLGTGTANITSDRVSKLYLAADWSFLEYEPIAGTWRALAAPPFSFSRWGALVYRDGVIYGLQGNNGIGFAKYSVSEDRWDRLPSVPGGTTLGAAFDEGSNELVAVGPYYGRNYYAYSVTESQWSASTIPFFSVHDGGLAHLPNSGVYFLQGETGSGFAFVPSRLTWLSVSPTSVTLQPQQSSTHEVRADASGLLGGLYQAAIRVESNDPDEPSISVPVRLTVTGVPDIRLLGERTSSTSTATFATTQATTNHRFSLGTQAPVSGELLLDATGDYGDSTEYATVFVEGEQIGTVGPTGTDCTTASGVFPLTPALLERVAQDGIIDVSVVNSAEVNSFCAPNQHTVSLRLRGPGSSVEFGSLFIGAEKRVYLEITNRGTDSLGVDSIVTSDGAFTAELAAPFRLSPAESKPLPIRFAPTIASLIEATLTISSNDPDSPLLEVALSGTGLVPPVIEIDPQSLSSDLYSGDHQVTPLTIRNTGGSELRFVTSIDSTSGPTVIDRSPAFTRAAVQDLVKDGSSPPAAVDPADIHTVIEPDNAAPPKAEARREQPLELWLANFSSRFDEVTSLIPNRFLFSDGDTGSSIGDGGNDMYDGGNYLQISSSYLSYTSGQILDHPSLGPGGRYFTRKVPGMFVFAADLNGVSDFTISGDLGADGGGSVDGSVLSLVAGGQRYRGFVKRVFNAYDPSVNHLIIVPESSGVTHEFSTYTNSDYHRVFDLHGTQRIYYLLMAGAGGSYIDDATMLAIMKRFIELTAPIWLTVAPESGSVAPGESATATVSFDATGLLGGDYGSTIVITSNDPLQPTVSVPVSLHVTGVPHISVRNPGLTVSSTRRFVTSRASTSHSFAVEPSSTPRAASLDVVVDGDFGDQIETATVLLEGQTVGALGATGFDCTASTHTIVLDPQAVLDASQDGSIDIRVDNSAAVDPSCSLNRHTVALTLDSDPARLDFGRILVGAQVTRQLSIDNTGSDLLQVSAIESSAPAISVSMSSAEIAPGEKRPLSLTFTASEAGVIDASVVFHTNDPRNPELSFPVRAEAVLPPRLEFSPSSISVDVPALSSAARTLRVHNAGDSVLRVAITSYSAASSDQTPQSALATGPPSYRPLEPEDTLGEPQAPSREARSESAVPAAGGSFYDGFEDGTLAPWAPGTFSAVVTSETAASGSRFSVRIDEGSRLPLTGLTLGLEPMQPAYVGFWVRTSTTSANTAYFVLRDTGLRELIFFFAKDTGQLYVNGDVGGDQSVYYLPDTWYHIEFKSIDFGAKRFDYFVDGTLIRSNIPFRNASSATAFERVDLYNFDLRSAWWDEVVLGDGPRSEWLQFEPNQLTIPPGQAADVALILDATNLDEGDFAGGLTLASNDPANRSALVPMSMHVIGVPDILLLGKREERQSSAPHYGRFWSTTHRFPFSEPPAGDVVVSVSVKGDFSAADEYATVTLDGLALGIIGRAGSDCDMLTADFSVSAATFAALVSDGVAEVTIANSGAVDSFCGDPLHLVTLRYNRPASEIDFGRLFTGGAVSVDLTISNRGVEPLSVSSIQTGAKAVSISPESMVIPARGQQRVQLRFAPSTAITLQDTLLVTSNDPDQPEISVSLVGEGVPPPRIHLSSDTLHATVLPDDVMSIAVDVSNQGGSGLLFDALSPVAVVPHTDSADLDRAATRQPTRAIDDMTTSTESTPPVPSEFAMANAKVLLIEDRYPYFTRSNEDALAALGIAYDRIQSVSLASQALTNYRLVIVAGDQTTAFYQTIAASMPKLEAWVSRGGTLQFHGESWGLGMGDPSVVTLPGGVVTPFEYADQNLVSLTGHRFVIGVPNQFTSYPASTAFVAGHPSTAEVVCVNQFGSPTLVFYSFGAGDVVVTTQTLERAYASYYPQRPILENLISSSAGGANHWLAFEPSRALVPALSTLRAAAMISALGLEPDRYEQSITLSSNDPVQPERTIAVQLDVVRLLAEAGDQQRLECEVNNTADTMLQATASRHVDGFGAIQRFEWSENGVVLAQGATAHVPLAVGSHDLQLAIFDAAADTNTDSLRVEVTDTVPPTGSFTYPSAKQCVRQVPVTALDNATDACTGSAITRRYDRPGGAVFTTHGDQSVSMTVSDSHGNEGAPISLSFTIDLMAPVTSILFDPNRWTFPRMIPFQQTFSAHDTDGASGAVVRERILVDGCVFYDGNSYGDNDGLLLDETLPAAEDELCRLKRVCGRKAWSNPVISVEATDCAGNVSIAKKTKPGSYNANRCP